MGSPALARASRAGAVGKTARSAPPARPERWHEPSEGGEEERGRERQKGSEGANSRNMSVSGNLGQSSFNTASADQQPPLLHLWKQSLPGPSTPAAASPGTLPPLRLLCIETTRAFAVRIARESIVQPLFKLASRKLRSFGSSLLGSCLDVEGVHPENEEILPESDPGKMRDPSSKNGRAPTPTSRHLSAPA